MNSGSQLIRGFTPFPDLKLSPQLADFSRLIQLSSMRQDFAY
jgi:hypothetical protein